MCAYSQAALEVLEESVASLRQAEETGDPTTVFSLSLSPDSPLKPLVLLTPHQTVDCEVHGPCLNPTQSTASCS